MPKCMVMYYMSLWVVSTWRHTHKSSQLEMAHLILAAVLILLQWQYSTSIQSSPLYTPVCPGDTVIFTCSSNTGGLYWSLDSAGTNSRGYLSITTLGIIQHLGIFTFNLTSKIPNLTSTATVHSVTISQTATDIYCSSDVNFNQMVQMDTLNVRS